jgi:hypothetical protein
MGYLLSLAKRFLEKNPLNTNVLGLDCKNDFHVPAMLDYRKDSVAPFQRVIMAVDFRHLKFDGADNLRLKSMKLMDSMTTHTRK